MDWQGPSPDRYVYFAGRRIAWRKPTGEVRYYFADHLGSARVVTNEAGQILEESDFYPFGGERVISNTNPDPIANTYKFTGQERDWESGLDYFGARHYASGLGRLLSVDPSRASANPSDPPSWNRYSYTYNNPLKFP